MIKNFHQINIKSEETILYALKHMDKISRKLLLVIEEGKYVGLLSIGDIQRAIIANVDLKEPVRSILQTSDRVVARPENSIDEVKATMLEHRTEFMPVVNSAGELVNVYFWEDLFMEEKEIASARIDLPVVIMAGGTGDRLKPLTNVLPKPLIPINDKTMLEEIIERFGRFGSTMFYLSVNYKAELIKYYMTSLNLEQKILFIEEDKPFGTAGSLSLLKGKISGTFFVTNCDNLIDQDYNEILSFHKKNKNEVTIIAALKNYPIAYGTIETEGNGDLATMVEKPELTFKINSGMYVLESHLIDEIPEDEVYNMTDLINSLKRQNRKVGVFPVWQSSWIDIGDWDQYISVLRFGKK